MSIARTGGEQGRIALLALLVAVGLVSAGVFAVTFLVGRSGTARRLQLQVNELEQEVSTLIQENEDLRGTIQETSRERDTLDQRVASLLEQLTTATHELERTRSNVSGASDRFEQLDAERSQLQDELSTVRTERDALAQEVEAFQYEQAKLERTISTLQHRLALLNRDYQRLAARLTGPAIPPNPHVNVVASAGAGTWPPTLNLPAPSVSLPAMDVPQAAVAIPSAVESPPPAGAQPAVAVELSPIIIREGRGESEGATAGRPRARHSAPALMAGAPAGRPRARHSAPALMAGAPEAPEAARLTAETGRALRRQRLDPIIVERPKPQDPAALALSESIRGQLVDVNTTHGFVVIDRGQEHGVRTGMIVDLLRDEAPVGRAKVVRVRPLFSAGQILPDETPGDVVIGDQAVFAGS